MYHLNMIIDDHGRSLTFMVNRFKLRCRPNRKGKFVFAIQLVALPLDCPSRSEVKGLRTKCILSEPTTGHLSKFDMEFDFAHSSRKKAIMDAGKLLEIDDEKELEFRMEIVVDKSDDGKKSIGQIAMSQS